MKQEYKEAFTEVHEIIKLMPSELIDKIPIKFIEMLEEEKDREYRPNIQEPLENQKLKNETIIILGLIYRDFLCAPEERKRLQEKDAKELKEAKEFLEEELRQKYNPDDIFKHKKTTIDEEQVQEQSISVIEEEKWYKKIFKIIKNLFKKKEKF